MVLTIEKGQVKNVPEAPLTKAEKNALLIREKTKFHPAGSQTAPAMTANYVAKPIFCVSCLSKTVEVKNQLCESCVQKVENNQSAQIGKTEAIFLISLVIALVGTAVIVKAWFF